MLLLSGGESNINPLQSIGGEPSYRIVNPVHYLNNMFDNLSNQQMSTGHTNYRCIYVMNRNVNTLYGTEIYVENNTVEGVNIAVGCDSSTEIQGIKIDAGAIEGNTFRLSIESQETPDIVFSSDIATCINNIQTAIQTISYFEETTIISAAESMPIPSDNPSRGPIYYYQVTFVGSADHHAIALMVVSQNNLGVQVNTCRLSHGSPINAIAPKMDFDIIIPNEIVFTTTSELSPLSIGDLQSGDIFAIWVRRQVDATEETDSRHAIQLVIRGYLTS